MELSKLFCCLRSSEWVIWTHPAKRKTKIVSRQRNFPQQKLFCYKFTPIQIARNASLWDLIKLHTYIIVSKPSQSDVFITYWYIICYTLWRHSSTLMPFCRTKWNEPTRWCNKRYRNAGQIKKISRRSYFGQGVLTRKNMRKCANKVVDSLRNMKFKFPWRYLFFRKTFSVALLWDWCCLPTFFDQSISFEWAKFEGDRKIKSQSNLF